MNQYNNSEKLDIICQIDTVASVNEWRVVNDGVMGGVSSSKVEFNPKGFLTFSGTVRLENNGGFTSIRSTIDASTKEKKQIVLKVKGDGKRYQLRIKKERSDYYSYIHYFETEAGKWQEIAIALSEMKPSYRGRYLDMDNFSADKIKEVSILIANKAREDFVLDLKSISLKS